MPVRDLLSLGYGDQGKNVSRPATNHRRGQLLMSGYGVGSKQMRGKTVETVFCQPPLFGTGLKPGMNEENFEARCRKGARYHTSTEFDFRLVANHRRNRDRGDWLRNGFEPARRFEPRHLTSYRWRTNDSCSYFD